MPPRAHCSQALEQPRRVRRVTASFGRVAAATGLAVACGRESTKGAGDPRGWVVRGCSRHGAQLMGASGARCRGKACHGVANDAVAATNERRRHGRRALGRQRRAPCCHNATNRALVVAKSKLKLLLVEVHVRCPQHFSSPGLARSAPTNGGTAGHSTAVAEALEDERWPGCQGSRASATGYDRALLALSRVLNPTTRATRRHTA